MRTNTICTASTDDIMCVGKLGKYRKDVKYGGGS